MPTYTLRYHPDVVASDLPRLDSSTTVRIGNAIQKKLLMDPTRLGAPLRHTLKGYWKLRIGDYRVVYRIVEIEIRIVAIIHRSRVYEIAPKRI